MSPRTLALLAAPDCAARRAARLADPAARRLRTLSRGRLRRLLGTRPVGRAPRLVRFARSGLGRRVERRAAEPIRPGRKRLAPVAPPRCEPAYAVFVDDRDIVWLTDFGGDALVRFDPATESFQMLPWPTKQALVRQLLGRPGEVWGAESATDKLVVYRSG